MRNTKKKSWQSGGYGLGDKTKVVVIDDIRQLVPGLYERMKTVSEDPYFLNIRVMKNILSNKPLYCLVNYLKLFFINKAKRDFGFDTQMAWVDFGFNHGGTTYKNPLQFDFLWEYDCENRARFFYEDVLDDRPMFEVIRTVKPDPMLGAMFLVPATHTERLWNTFLENINSMLDMGFIDDDQPLLLMTYRKTKDISIATKCRNCEQLRLCGASHMAYSQTKIKLRLLRRIKHYIDVRLMIHNYHKCDRKILLNTKL